MNAIIIKENKKRCPFYIKEEKNEKFILFKVFDEYKNTKKRLLKKLNKRCIVNIAFDNTISRDFTEYFSGKINVLTKENILLFNIDKIILKLANSLGIKEGRLTLGLIPGYNTGILMKKTEKIRNKLKSVIIYCDCKDEFLNYIDAFYEKTGVPVIVKEEFNNIECDILVNLNYNKTSLGDYKGKLVDILGITDEKGIRDIKVNLKENDNIYNISDAVFSKILSEPFEISSFIIKNT